VQISPRPPAIYQVMDVVLRTQVHAQIAMRRHGEKVVPGDNWATRIAIRVRPFLYLQDVCVPACDYTAHKYLYRQSTALATLERRGLGSPAKTDMEIRPFG
jgi:hypothetical protein